MLPSGKSRKVQGLVVKNQDCMGHGDG